jgi:hypothetical protein
MQWKKREYDVAVTERYAMSERTYRHGNDYIEKLYKYTETPSSMRGHQKSGRKQLIAVGI